MRERGRLLKSMYEVVGKAGISVGSATPSSTMDAIVLVGSGIASEPPLRNFASASRSIIAAEDCLMVGLWKLSDGV